MTRSRTTLSSPVVPDGTPSAAAVAGAFCPASVGLAGGFSAVGMGLAAGYSPDGTALHGMGLAGSQPVNPADVLPSRAMVPGACHTPAGEQLPELGAFGGHVASPQMAGMAAPDMHKLLQLLNMREATAVGVRPQGGSPGSFNAAPADLAWNQFDRQSMATESGELSCRTGSMLSAGG